MPVARPLVGSLGLARPTLARPLAVVLARLVLRTAGLGLARRLVGSLALARPVAARPARFA